MTLQVETLVCGPIENNVFIIFDTDTKEAVVIDPSFEPEKIIFFLQENHLHVNRVLITHAHFDHFYGLPHLLQKISSINTVHLHKLDLLQWQSGGGARKFLGSMLDVNAPFVFVNHSEKVPLGKSVFEVRHVPGHSSGSVIYYCEEIHSAFVGDLIFYHSVGRTDLEDGDGAKLLQSIQSQILTLPDDTVLYPGHGPATTVAEEAKHNPYI